MRFLSLGGCWVLHFMLLCSIKVFNFGLKQSPRHIHPLRIGFKKIQISLKYVHLKWKCLSLDYSWIWLKSFYVYDEPLLVKSYLSLNFNFSSKLCFKKSCQHLCVQVIKSMDVCMSVKLSLMCVMRDFVTHISQKLSV